MKIIEDAQRIRGQDKVKCDVCEQNIERRYDAFGREKAYTANVFSLETEQEKNVCVCMVCIEFIGQYIRNEAECITLFNMKRSDFSISWDKGNITQQDIWQHEFDRQAKHNRKQFDNFLSKYPEVFEKAKKNAIIDGF